MKRAILFLMLGIFTLSIFSSCSKDKNKTPQELVVGKWKTTITDDDGSNTYVMVYSSDGTFSDWNVESPNDVESGTWSMAGEDVHNCNLTLTFNYDNKKSINVTGLKNVLNVNTLKSTQSVVTFVVNVNFSDSNTMVWNSLGGQSLGWVFTRQ